jgi:hypothetical protein
MKSFLIISLLFIANFAFAQEEMIISCQIQSYDWKKYANKNFIQLKSIVSQSKRQGREMNL